MYLVTCLPYLHADRVIIFNSHMGTVTLNGGKETLINFADQVDQVFSTEDHCDDKTLLHLAKFDFDGAH